MAQTLQAENGLADPGATGVTTTTSLGLVGSGAERSATAAVLEERGIDFLAADAAADLDPDRTLAAVILCTGGTLAVGAEIGALRAAAGAAPVVVVCAKVRPGELRQALAAGISGVVLESTLATALQPTLDAARAGHVCVPRREALQIEPSTLSTREKQILGLVVMGYMNSEIAEQLFVAVSTVKSHLSSAFGKLGVRSRNEAVELIVDPERGLGMGILAIGGEPIETGGSAR